jgi:hypothetical protein
MIPLEELVARDYLLAASFLKLRSYDISTVFIAIPADFGSNRIMNFRPNGLDKHLVLRPVGESTNDTLFLENGRLTYDGRHAVIDLEVRFLTPATFRHAETIKSEAKSYPVQPGRQYNQDVHDR